MVPRWTVRLVFAAVVGAIPSVGWAQTTEAEELDGEQFCTSLASQHFEIWSETGLPLQLLIDVAEDTQRRSREWLGMPDPPAGQRTEIHLVRNVVSLYLLEERNGLSPSRDYPDERSFRGRCHPEVGLIVVPIDTFANLRWQIAHEVTHVVFHELVRRNVPIANEGLAELLPDWILGTNAGTPDTFETRSKFYDRRLARAVLAREAPNFTEFLRVDDATFYDPHAEWLWYALSWKLAKVLVERETDGTRGQYRAFLGALAKGKDIGSSLTDVYDLGTIEAEWRSEIERAATWRPLFGEWRDDYETLVGSVAGLQSACALLGPALAPAQEFQIALSLDAPPAQSVAFGFALDARGMDDFVYVEFRPGCRSVIVAERSAGRWLHVDERAIPAELQLLSNGDVRRRRISLRAEGAGVFDLRVDGRTIVRHELGRELKGGFAGVMLERCDSVPSDNRTSTVRFRDVRITR